MDYIILENVNKTLKGRNVLTNISLKLEKGKVYAFFGRNASGKTMLFRVISGLVLPSSGNVEVFGQQVSKDKVFPKNMGLIIESVGLWPHLTGLENLELIAGIKRIVSITEIKDSLCRVGLNPEDVRKYKAYSMGMRQKLILAQAIMEKPDLLILDEPTNGLDEESIALFRNIVVEEKGRGATCLIATHQISDIVDLYDEVYQLKEGYCSKAVEGGL